MVKDSMMGIIFFFRNVLSVIGILGICCRAEVGKQDVFIILNPIYAEVGDLMTVSCVAANHNGVIIMRNNKLCVADCEDTFPPTCNQTDRIFATHCSDGTVTITLNPVIQDDFGNWTCLHLMDGSDSEILHQFFYSTLQLTKFHTEVTENESTAFECQATNGTPPALIAWYLDDIKQENGFVQDNSTGVQISTFTFLPYRNQSKLTCKAMQVVNKEEHPSETSSFNVLYAPTKASSNGTELTLVDEEVTLSCYVDPIHDGYPPKYNFTWTRSGDERFTTTTVGGNYIFKPNNVGYDDTYSCLPINEAGQGSSAEVNLTVNSPPDLLLPGDNIIKVFNEDSLNVGCVVGSKPELTSFMWQNLGDIFISLRNETMEEDKLLIQTEVLLWGTDDTEHRKDANNMVVTCSAANGYGNDIEENFSLNVEFIPEKPVLKLNPTIADVEQNITLTCTFDGVSSGNPPSVKTAFRGENSPPQDFHTNETTLTLSSVDQEQQYYCAGINIPENKGERKGHESQGVLVEVLVPPKVLVTNNGSYTVNPKHPDPFTLSCDAGGKPHVDIYWTRNDEAIKDDIYFFPPDLMSTDIVDYHGLTKGNRSFLSWKPQPGLTCESVEIYDGTYNCIAKNNGTHGNRESSSMNIDWTTYYQPIWMGNTTFLAERNSTIMINCSVCAKPIPGTFIWYKNGTVISESQQLKLEELAKDSFGSYECSATNVVNETTTVIEIVESGRPFIQNVTSLFNSTSTVVPLTWIVDSEGGWGPLTFTVWAKRASDDDYILISEDIPQYGDEQEHMVIDIIGVKPGTEYQFMVRAKNNRDIDHYSDNKTTDAKSRESPVIKIKEVDVDDGSMEVKLDYVSSIRKRLTLLNQEYMVTVCIKYWLKEEGEENAKFHPDEYNCTIPASTSIVKIKDEELNRKLTYSVTTLVYENGFLGSNNAEDPMVETTPDSKLDPGDKAGIAISVIVFLALAVVSIALLVYKGYIPVGRTKPEPESERSVMQDDSWNVIEQPELGEDPSAKAKDSDLKTPENGTYFDSKEQDIKGPTTARDNKISGVEEAGDHYADINFGLLVPVDKGEVPVEEDIKPQNYAYLHFHRENPNKSTEVTETKCGVPKERPAEQISETKNSKMEMGTAKRATNVKEVLNTGEEIIFKAQFAICGKIQCLHNGKEVVSGGRSQLSLQDGVFSVKISDAQREDSGRYTLTVWDGNAMASIDFYAVVIGKLVPPIPPFDDEDEIEIYGNLPRRFKS